MGEVCPNVGVSQGSEGFFIDIGGVRAVSFQAGIGGYWGEWTASRAGCGIAEYPLSYCFNDISLHEACGGEKCAEGQQPCGQIPFKEVTGIFQNIRILFRKAAVKLEPSFLLRIGPVQGEMNSKFSAATRFRGNFYISSMLGDYFVRN